MVDLCAFILDKPSQSDNFMTSDKSGENIKENGIPEDDSMDQMKNIDSMEEFNHFQKLQSRILQKLIDRIDQTENNIKSTNK